MLQDECIRLMGSKHRKILGFESEPVEPSILDGYDELNVAEAIERLEAETTEGDDLDQVEEYELANKKRKTVLEAVERIRNG